MQISVPFNNAPLLAESDVGQDLPFGKQCSIGGRLFNIDLKGFQHVSVEARRPALATTAEPGDAWVSIEGFWSRSAIDWGFGAGQRRFDQVDSSHKRFSMSKGVDPWTVSELKLLPTTSRVVTSGNENLYLLTVGSYLYMADGANLKFTQDPFSGSFTTVSGSSQINSITTDGVYVYAATPSGVFRSQVGSTSLTSFAAPFDADQVGYANGRLFATSGNRAVEIAGDGTIGGTGQLDDAERFDTFRFSAIVSAPNGVYLAGQSGDRSAIYFSTTNAQTGEMLPLTWVGEVEKGESITSMHFYGGIFLVTTDAGFRLAAISGNDAVVPGKLVPIPGGCDTIDGQGDFAWFSWSNYDSTSTGLGRANLGQFTESLVAAYASDLMATSQGRVVGITTFSGKRVFSVAFDGLYVEQTTLEPEGIIESGEVSWGTTIRKGAAALDLRHSPLEGSIVAELVLEDGTVQPVGQSAFQGQLSPPEPLELFDAEGEVVTLRLRLRRATDTTKGPVLRRWTMSAFIRPHRQDQFTVPVRLFQNDQTLERVPYDLNPLENFLFLKSLESTGALTKFVLGGQRYRVQVDTVAVQDPSEWNDQRNWFNTVALVQMTTQEPGR